MSQGLELFIRMHLEKTPSMQRGRQTLTGDVILGVLGKLQREHPLGSDAIMWRWLDDAQARERIEQRLLDELRQGENVRKDLGKHIVLTAIDAFHGTPTLDQARKLKTLWKSHSEQAKRSKRLIRGYKLSIAKAEKQELAATSEFRQKHYQGEIARLNGLVEAERARLDTYAEKQASKSTKCPKCAGTGQVKMNTCGACQGRGALRLTADDLKKMLRSNGLRMSEKLWRDELVPVFTHTLWRLDVAHDEAVHALSKYLVGEKAA
ncbi:TIGR02642 family protein [Salinivibrio sp. KP-1]|uniref:TIGR02642 family protein n=1 Tax=Salinivibrio sp. KP-1 TaxID=1406902 RepID=UPI0006984203|nr:TIGR02642 family protein [Salinivibrio sp. KP-1]